MDSKTCIQLKGHEDVHPPHGHEDVHPLHGLEDMHSIAGSVPLASAAWTRRRASAAWTRKRASYCMDTKTCILLQGPCLLHPLHGHEDVRPTAGSVPRAGPKEMFDRFAITRMYGECQLCIMHYALCIKRSLGHLRTGARRSSCNRMHVEGTCSWKHSPPRQNMQRPHPTAWGACS